MLKAKALLLALLISVPLGVAGAGFGFAQSGSELLQEQMGSSRSAPGENARAGGLPSGQGSSFGRDQQMAQEQMQQPNQTQSMQPALQPNPLYVSSKQLNAGRPFSATPAWTQSSYFSSNGAYPPFGANLFQGYFAGTFYDGMNPNYQIMPGDRIMINLWGAHAYSDILMVDQQGNIFLPEVGPVPVGGVRHASLEDTIKNYIASTFRTNVDIYVNLLTAQPVAVYVTGFVERPGRYAGGSSDTVLYYLDRAGGIIPDRGSYRDIKIQRHNQTVGKVDLYAFILSGQLSSGPLQDGDVIVVGPKGSSIIADGMIPQYASYECKGLNFKGSELTKLAAPLPAVSHVSVTGTRDTLPFHVYLSLQEFAGFTLTGHDRVEFLADRPGDSILIAVNGATLGPTRFPVKRGTTLRSLLAHVPVDGNLSNLDGIYLKRKSVVEQQRQAIQDSLYRLEKSVLTATSANAEGAEIRVREAELVQNFAERVNTLEPDGVVVVTKNGLVADILLEDGDVIVIPQISDVVQITGEVNIPKAVVYSKSNNLDDYIMSAGGFSDRADESNILVVHPNGEILQASNSNILPGDLLMVMPEYDTKAFSIFKDIIQVLYQVAIATKVVVDI